jgi:hypothetical protein
VSQPFTWTAAQDAQIRRLRAEGATWDGISQVIGRSAAAVRERGRRIGAIRPPPDFVPLPEDPQREPLPAGHERSWGAITRGTVLDGCPYPLPVFRR